MTGNGANRSATSAEATDMADNSTPGTTVDGINIDGLAPQTTADNQCTKVNNWCTGGAATVVLNATDQDGLSGVEKLHYRIDGGPEQVVAGGSATVSVPLDGSGEASVTFYAIDRAGNAERVTGVTLQYDNIAPMATHSLTPMPNADAWTVRT